MEHTEESLLKDGEVTAKLISDDLSIFEELPLKLKRQVLKLVRKVKPHPEFKEDHAWICEWMEEEIEGTPAEEIIPAEPVERVWPEQNAKLGSVLENNTTVLEFHQSESTYHQRSGDSDIPEAKELLTLRRRFDRTIKQLALPSSCLTPAGGQHLIAMPMLQRIEAELTSFIQVSSDLILRLPNSDGKVTTWYKFISNKPAPELSSLPAHLHKKMLKDITRRNAEAAVEIERALIGEFITTVGGLATRLSKDAKGNYKQLQAATIEEVRDFIELLPSRDVLGHKDLARLSHEVEGLLTGVDVEGLRADEKLRDKLASKLSSVTADAKDILG